MSVSSSVKLSAEKHFNIKITSEFSDDCIHYFYNILTTDGYELFVSTKDPNNIELSKNVFYYDNDLAGELTSVGALMESMDLSILLSNGLSSRKQF